MQKKKLIYFLVVILIVLVLCATAVVIYLETDLFKSDKQLFYKYLLEENQMLEILSDNVLENDNKSYTTSGNIEYIYEYDDEIEKIKNDEIAKNIQENIKKLGNLEGLNGTIESTVDNTNKKAYYNIKLQKDGSKIMSLELARDEDKYAFKSNELVDTYIGLESNNLKNLATKFGIENTENIPDNIDLSKIYQALLKIDSDEKEHVIETYKEVMVLGIDDSNYSKLKNQKITINDNEYITDLYSLSLSKTETIDIVIKMLETLKQDSITLNMIANKIKLIDPNSEYASISKLTEQIQVYIEEINKIEKSDKEFIRIDLYLDNKIVRQIDFVYENQKQISFKYEEKDGKKIVQINQKKLVEESDSIVYDFADSLLKTKQINIIKESDVTLYQFVMYDVEDIYKKILDEVQSDQQDIIQEGSIEEIKKIYNEYKSIDDELSKISFNIQINNNRTEKVQTSFYIKAYNSKIGINIVSDKKYEENLEKQVYLDDNNAIMLNNYSKEQIDKLMQSAKNKCEKILKTRLGI